MQNESEFAARLARHYDELKWLYCELYDNDMDSFRALTERMRAAHRARRKELRALDRAREADPDWYRGSGLLGMCLYVKPFAGTLNGVREKLDYIQEAGVNYLHLMPLLDTVDGESDGGYAVADYRKVKPELGTMEDLEALTAECRERGVCCCLDFVMNHTSSAHEWARRARAGEKEYQDYYFFYDSWDVPNAFERTVPQVFPTTAPGNFTELPDIGKVVMTCFYPYQWDLNYANPAVFNAMVDNLLFLANRGIDILRVDAVPYIWKRLGTTCRNLPQVHTIMRMVRMICEIVCPGVLLLGEVVMAPRELAPYFGTPEKPECHLLYNATAMCTIWHTVATRDARLLRHQIDALNALPDGCIFLNYLRCHDDIGWGLDFPWLAQFGMEEVPHKKFLNDYFAGDFPGSPSRGERYNDDPRLGDARMCGTTASLCGVESAEQAGDAEALERAISLDLTLHALIFTLSGVPVLYAGDEIGQLNDSGYRADPAKADDSRYIHRGDFPWDAARERFDASTRPGKLFQGLRALERLRCGAPIFHSDARVSTFDAGSVHLLGIRRKRGGAELIAAFNFGDGAADTALDGSGRYANLATGEVLELPAEIRVPPRGFVWLARDPMA